MDPLLLLPKDFVASPEALARTYSRSQAAGYTRWLATHHYENFRVVSFLLPARLHQDFHNLYAFCRWADDLGDELGGPAESLRWLEWWRLHLERMFAGEAAHPVFVALEETVRRHRLPIEPFADLISAFVRDQTIHRYQTCEELLGYCRHSANPVGRLVLNLCGYDDAERQRLSDATCTALQLANFWQDVAVDLGKGRIYIPQEVMRRHGYSMEALERRDQNASFRLVMRELVGWARGFFRQGRPLAGMVGARLALDLDLFSRGGLRLLEKIEKQDYTVLERRPVVSRRDQFLLLVKSLARLPWRGKA